MLHGFTNGARRIKIYSDIKSNQHLQQRCTECNVFAGLVPDSKGCHSSYERQKK